MNFDVQCIYAFAVLLVLIIPVFTVNDSLSHYKHRRQKRDVVEDLKCKQDILKNGMSMINYGIENITNRTASLQGGFFESLRLVFNEMQRNKSAAERKIGAGLQQSFLDAYNSLDEKIKETKNLESALIWLYTKDNSENAFYKKVNTALSGHKCTSKTLTKGDKDQCYNAL